ncbi:MAG: sensor histidine kinase, partial [Burkholderiaceae bacterium]
CHSARGQLTGWIVSIADISAIRAAERSHEETVRFLSHDMRAPQASILALLELQNQPASALTQEEFFARIERACRKTLGLADNFVHLARAESNEYRMEEIDFQEIVFDATDEMWTLARNKQIYLTSDVDRGEYPTRIDRSLMTRALINLISNAIHYSPSGTRIVCSLHIEMVPYAPLVVFRIADEGYGIAEEDQARLFQRFQRFEIAGQPRQDGSGLGLAFVKTVVERHHGRIAVDSRVGKGTTFTIKLPLIS